MQVSTEPMRQTRPVQRVGEQGNTTLTVDNDESTAEEFQLRSQRIAVVKHSEEGKAAHDKAKVAGNGQGTEFLH